MKPHEFLFALTATVGALWAAEYTPAQGGLATPRNIGIVPVAHRDSQLVAFHAAGEWLNSKPLTASQLHGKVVLVNFWTYSCINWQRELPYVRAWAGKYKDQGLVVVGVHSPEFGFERDLARVRDASAQLNVSYPIAVDSEHAIWNAFGNAYWPAIYIIDANGRLRYTHFGEGDYERTEKFIQRLLAEA